VRRIVPLLGAVGLLLLGPIVLGFAAVASAHAQLVSSEPGAGEVLFEPPTEIRIVFSEPLEPAYSSMNLKDSDENEYEKNFGAPDPNDPYTLVAPLTQIVDGGWVVEWQALSAADGHSTEGFVSFGVNDFPIDHSTWETDGGTHSLNGVDDHGGGFALDDPATWLATLASPFEIFARAVTYLGLLTALGLLFVGWFVVRPAYGRVPHGLVRAQALALGIGAIGAMLLAVQISIRTGLDVVTYLTTSRTGAIVLQRIVVGLVGLAIMLVFVRLRRDRSALAIGGLTAFLSIVLLALGGHAAAYTSPAPMIAMIVHLVSAAIWLAGLIVLLALARRDDRPPMSAIVPRFSALALFSIALLAATGLYTDWLQTRDVLGMDTGYQFFLAIKIAFVAAALALGGLNFLDGGREVHRFGGLRLRVGAEVFLAVMVLVVTANLGSGFPPASDAAIRIATAPSSAIVENNSDIVLEMGPGRPGPNRYNVYVEPPVSIYDDSVSIELDRLDANSGPTKLYLIFDETVLWEVGPDGVATKLDPNDRPVDEEGNPIEEPRLPGVDRRTTTWYTDGGLLPANSRWTATIAVTDREGAEKGYSRFEFALDDTSLVEGREAPAPDMGIVVGFLLLCFGVLTAVYAFAGGSLPRVHPRTGRIAMAASGVVGLVVGMSLVTFGVTF
jgi:copper transport protein